MDVFHYPDIPLFTCRYASTIGFFDGVHLGHRYLLRRLVSESSSRGLRSMAVTFDRHPREVVQAGWQPQLLSTLDEKVALLSQTGIDALTVVHFDESIAALSARDFMSDVLHCRLHCDLLLTGYDNRFGHGRSESFADYAGYGSALGMEVVCAEPLLLGADVCSSSNGAEAVCGHCPDGVAVCSSLVRRLLSAGDVSGAARCLGRPYSLSGHVVHGEHNGHALGFPTANLMPSSPQKLVPSTGCYAVVAVLADGTRHHGMTNIGTRPTFHGHGITLETNIFDTPGDIYGQPLTIEFVARLRDEQSFSSVSDLASQLSADRQRAESLLCNLHV